MTPDEAKKLQALAPIIAAYAEGKTIQYREVFADYVVDPRPWRDDPYFNPLSFSHLEYRVKPELREFWSVYDGEDNVVRERLESLEVAMEVLSSKAYGDFPPYYIMHSIEVMVDE